MNRNQILREADRCVKCGLCLPHCPTYRLSRDEGDSPRGRIALIQALASGQVGGTALGKHLERCLGCLACQSACPSGVKYGFLIDAAKTLTPTRGRLVRRAISWLPYRSWSAPLLRFFGGSGLRRLSRTIGGRRFRRLEQLMPPAGHLPGGWKRLYPAGTGSRGRVGLFTGCVGRLADHEALSSAIRVLNRLGLDVVVPENQGCCGALHLHNGDEARSESLAEQNLKAFNREEIDALLFLASGCGAHLAGMPFHAPVLEISRYLDDMEWPPDVALGSLEISVALHTPCSLRHHLKMPWAPENLLKRIPGVKLLKPVNPDCCGAAGSFLLQQPEIADSLRDASVSEIERMGVEYLATGNTGCAMHLASGLRESGADIKTVYPVQLIEMSMNGHSAPEKE